MELSRLSGRLYGDSGRLCGTTLRALCSSALRARGGGRRVRGSAGVQLQLYFPRRMMSRSYLPIHAWLHLSLDRHTLNAMLETNGVQTKHEFLFIP